ncbi:MAG: hypothetical protein OXE02_03615 [Chloroflexi bacterium]|nr:hypothetical protein [Chloroflexota bacterium]
MDACLQVLGILALTAFVYVLLPDAVHRFCYGARRRIRRLINLEDD